MNNVDADRVVGAILIVIAFGVGALIGPVRCSDAPISPVSVSASVNHAATDAYHTIELIPERNRDDEAYVECQLRHGDGQVVAERKWFQVLSASPMRTAWVVDSGRAGPYAVYCRALHINGHYIYPFGTDEGDPDGWQYIGGWQESHLFYLPIVWKHSRG